MSNYVGKSIKRVEDPRFLQGKARYVANLSLPGMVHVAVKRSPHAHAIINIIDTSAAAALDGVVAVYTGQDLLDSGVGPLPCGFTPPDIKTPAHNSLAVDKVRHVGDGVETSVSDRTCLDRRAAYRNAMRPPYDTPHRCAVSSSAWARTSSSWVTNDPKPSSGSSPRSPDSPHSE